MAGGYSPKPLPKDTQNQGGLAALVPFHLHQCHSVFIIKTCPHDQQTSQGLPNDGRCPGLGLGQDSRSKARCHSEARIKARINRGYGLLHTSHLHSHQIMDSRVIGSQHQLHHQLSSMSERSGGSRHPHCGRHPHREPGGHMKINLVVIKDEDTKDAITYQSWHWDLTVYHCAGCWDHTLLPYAICSLQGYPGELMRGSGMYISLDDILTILDEHYNNVKALDALNQEIFQLCMGKKRHCQAGGCAYQGTCRSSQLHSWNAFPQTM